MECKTPTRADYMANRCDFETYHRAVAKTAGYKFPGRAGITLDEVRSALRKGDEHLNTIQLSRWDSIAAAASPALNRALRAHGDIPSLAGLCCIVKQSAIDAAKTMDCES